MQNGVAYAKQGEVSPIEPPGIDDVCHVLFVIGRVAIREIQSTNLPKQQRSHRHGCEASLMCRAFLNSGTCREATVFSRTVPGNCLFKDCACTQPTSPLTASRSPQPQSQARRSIAERLSSHAAAVARNAAAETC